MANNFLRAGIRLDKIQTRNNKPHYSHLTKEQYTFIKIVEEVKGFEKAIGHLDLKEKNWRKTEYGSNLLGRYSKVVDKEIKLSDKLNLTELEENRLYESCHNSRFYGGSY